MIADPHKLLDLYKRELITDNELELGVIHAAVDFPPEELVARLPAVVVEAIREKAAMPAETTWRTVYIGTCDRKVDPEAIAAHRQEEQARLNDGIARWREYFNRTGRSS